MFLPYFLLVGLHLCQACRRWSLNVRMAFLGPSFLPGFVSWHAIKQILEETKASSPEVQGAELAVCSPHSPEDLSFHHFMVTALHIPHQTLVVVRSGFSLGCLLVSSSVIWRKKNCIHAYQKLPGLWVPCCVFHFNRYQGDWKPPWAPGLVNVRLLLSVCRGLFPFDLPCQVVCGRPSL